MKFAFIAKHRGVWPAEWICGALVLRTSRGGFYAWLTRPRSARSRSDEDLAAKVRASFLASDRTYGARRVWHDLIADGAVCGLHRVERLMRNQALKARPRRRRLPPDCGEWQTAAIAPNTLDRSFEAAAPNRKWIADFTYIWTAEGWLYVAAVIDLFSRRGDRPHGGFEVKLRPLREPQFARTREQIGHELQRGLGRRLAVVVPHGAKQRADRLRIGHGRARLDLRGGQCAAQGKGRIVVGARGGDGVAENRADLAAKTARGLKTAAHFDLAQHGEHFSGADLGNGPIANERAGEVE